MLILGGISGAGMMTMVEEYRPIFIGVTFALLATAFYLTYRPRAKAQTGVRSHLMGFNKIMLWVATAAAVVMLCFPNPTGLFHSTNRFTSDMHKTVFQIEGMT